MVEPDDATLRENLTWLDLTDNTACLFDMALHLKWTDMCNATNANFTMSMLASDALIWSQPDRAVTFVESHDTICLNDSQPKPLPDGR